MPKRKDLSLSDQLKVLEYLDQKQSQTAVAKKFEVSQSQISRIGKHRREILTAKFECGNQDIKRRRDGKDSNVDVALKLWFNHVRSKDEVVTGPILMEKANELAKMMNREDFSASNGWLCRWKARNGIRYNPESPTLHYNSHRFGINGSTSSSEQASEPDSKTSLHSIKITKYLNNSSPISPSIKDNAAEKSKITSATCTITPSGVHISQRSLNKQDVPSSDNTKVSNVSAEHGTNFTKAAKSFHSDQNTETSPFQNNLNENGRIIVESDGELDQYCSEGNCDDETNSAESTDGEVEKHDNRKKIVPKIIIKEVQKPASMKQSPATVTMINSAPETQENAPLDLCVKPVNSNSAPVPSSIITKHSVTSESGPPSIKVLPIYSSDISISANKKLSTAAQAFSASKIIGSSNDPLTITRISPSATNNGIKKSMKSKHQKICPNPVSDKERQEQRKKQEELRDQLEKELRHQQQQLKVAKKLAMQREKESVEQNRLQNCLNHSPKKRGRPPKMNSQPTIVNINSRPVSNKPKPQQLLPATPTIEINIKTAPSGSECKTMSYRNSPDNDSPLNVSTSCERFVSSNDDSSSGSSSGETGSSSGTDSESDEEAGSIHSDGTGNSSVDGIKRDSSEPQNLSTNNDSASSKKRTVTDEREIRIPLEHGWRRQTRIRCFSQSGVRGEVMYFAPCGKKLKTYPEISRYLEKHGITDISRENFSFSSKYNIGEFLEVSIDGGTNNYNLVSEAEILARLNELRTRKGKAKRKRGRPPSQFDQEGAPISKRQSRPEQELNKLDENTKLQRKRKRLEEEKALHIIKEAKKSQEELKRQKDQIKFLKMQDKLEMQRKQQVQQMMEERELKRQQAIILKEQEMQKQREILMVIDLERERRRQHMLLVKALEARKKQEEQRRIELEVLSEMKKPVDDMELKNQRPLPTLNRIPGVKLTSQAFGNILMVFEFLHNFGESLGFDTTSLPTLNTLQLSLLNDSEGEDELVGVLQQLLTSAIDDPGLPFYPKTILGQSLKDVSITSANISEVLRLYFYANSGTDNEMYILLKDHPFFSLNPTQKSDIVSFLCDELLGSRILARQVDMGLESVANYRKDKWLVEGELRRFRTLHAKKRHKMEFIDKFLTPSNNTNNERNDSEEKKTDENSTSTPVKILEGSDSNQGNLKDVDDDAPGNESGNETDDTQETIQPSVPDMNEDGMSIEEIDKKIDKLSKQWKQVRQKLQKATYSVRAITYGQDRYRRRYWVLPTAGGMYVESMESSEPPGGDKFYSSNPSSEEKDDEDEDKEEIKPETENIKNDCVEDTTQKPIDKTDMQLEKNNSSETEIKIKQESDEITKNKSKVSESSPIVLKFESTDPVKNEKPVQIANGVKNEPFLEKSNEYKDNAVRNSPDITITAEKPILSSSFQSLESNPTTYSPYVDPNALLNKDINNAAILGMFGKYDTSMQNSNFNPFTQNYLSSALALNAEQILKGSIDSNSNSTSNDAKPWFSLLPRAPCDDTSLTKNLGLDKCITEESPQFTTHPSISTATTLQGYPSNFSPMPMMSYMNGSNFLSPGMFNPAQFSSPYGSVFPPMMIPGFGFNPPITTAAPNPMCSQASSTSTTMSPVGTTVTTTVIEPSLYEPLPKNLQAAVLDRLRQYKKPQPIPTELARGWWRITDENHVRTLIKSLHSRGVRERLLYKNLDKYMELAIDSCSLGKQEEIGLNITDEDRVISQKLGGAPDPEIPGTFNTRSAVKSALGVLEQVEAMEERVFSASMHVKGWKLPRKLAADDTLELVIGHDTNVEEFCQCFSRKSEDVKPSSESNNESNDECSVDNKNVECTSDEFESQDEKLVIDMSDSQDQGESEKEKNEEENTSNSNNSTEQTENKDDETKEESITTTKVCPILLAQEKLRNLERSIERRYLKPPLARPISNHQVNMIVTYSEDDIPNGLNNWRNAVDKAVSSSQLAMCLQMLTNCVAWDKSIMKASCQFCHSGDNEEMLLLCDNCDKGYHTYCFKPEMDKIPEGDWFCYECLNKGTGDKLCCLCGKKCRQMVTCDTCPKLFHVECLELSKAPRGRWNCPCCNFRSNNRTKRKPPKSRESKEVKDTPESEDQKTSKASEKRKNNKMTTSLKTVVGELEKHEDAWPFLLPVNTKQFTTYKKIIKKPMDLSTIRTKLQDGQYESREEFVQDVTLIFDNCETFNEDDSPVGKAGHNLRSFFTSCMMDLSVNQS